MIRTAPALLAAALLAAAPDPAAARPPRRSEMLSVWGVLDAAPVSGLGLGGRLMLPVVPEGFLRHPRVKDELAIEVGADFVRYEDRVAYPGTPSVSYSWSGFLPVAGATWNFWLTPRFALYPKVDLGYWFGWYAGWSDPYGYGRPRWGGTFLQGALGAIWRLEGVALRVELGSDLLRLGAGFPF